MDRLTMAHEYAMLHMSNPQYKYVDDLEVVQWAFDYADAMQAEANKREVGVAELMKDHEHDYIYGRICACGSVNGAKDENIKPSLLKDEISGFFINIETNDVIYSESDIISHDWRRIPDNVDFVALRLIDSKMFFCVASEVDEGKFKVIWNRPTEEWQPDWSRIPDHVSNEVVAWQIDFNHQPVWVLEDGSCFQAPLFGYVGSRQDSLRKRPQ